MVPRTEESKTGVVRKRAWLAAASVALLAVLLVLVLPDQASAYSVKKSGRPGGTPTVYKVQGSHFGVECGLPYGVKCYTSWLIANGPVVTRSPAYRGTQRVFVLYTFKRWNGRRYAPFYRASAVRYMGARTSAIRLPYGRALPNPNYGYFRVQINIYWRNASGSRGYGSKALYFNKNGDYWCNTGFTSACSVGYGAVYLKGATSSAAAGRSAQSDASDSRQTSASTASEAAGSPPPDE